ncbi:hypothetical protein V8B97DRAFT_2025226 [Scleroderma yunnanense]
MILTILSLDPLVVFTLFQITWVTGVDGPAGAIFDLPIASICSTGLSGDSPSDHTNSDHESDCSSEHTESPLAQGGNLQEEEIKILEADIDQWKSANKNKRTTVVTCIRSKIKNLEANKTLKTHEWVRKKKAIQSWLYNHSQGHTQKALLRYGRSWMTRMKDINLVLEKAGIKQGFAQMIKGYQKVVYKVMETLTEEEKAEAEELAKAWNEQHPPLDVQAKNAEKKGQQYAEEFAKEMWKWCGARVVVMVAWKDNHGEVMLEHCQQKFVQYSRITFNTDDNGKKSNTNNKPRNLVRKSKARPQMKDIMRAFVTFYYRKASGKPTTTVPWGAIASNTSTYIASKYLPCDVTFKEPTHLTQDEVTRMLELWRDQKENNPDNIFHFSWWQDADGSLQMLVTHTKGLYLIGVITTGADNQLIQC